MHTMTSKFMLMAATATLITGAAHVTPAFSQTFELEEIVVTARKKEESLQSAPISITAFTADALDRRAVNDLSEVAPFVPNLQFDTAAPFSGSNVNATIFIRGIGQNDIQLAVDPGIGVYVDGVYMSRSVGQILEMVDIERVEVLRGPQGTLFGRNTIGGAINITTKAPGEEFGGRIALETGTDWDSRVQASLSGPLSDKLRAGLSVLYHYRENTIEGVGNNAPNLGERNSFTGRFRLDADVSEKISLSLIADATVAREPSGSNVLIGYFPGSAFGEAHNFFFSGNPAVCGNPASATYLTDPGCFNQQWVLGEFASGSTFETTPERAALIEEVQGKSYEPRSDLNLWGLSLALDWEVNDSIQFKAISAVRKVDADYATDADHSPHLIVHSISSFDTTQFTQEFQLVGSSFEDRLNWILGAYYFYEDGENLTINDTNLTMFRTGSIIKTNSYALFSQATYDVTDKLALTLGLRWTDESKAFDAGEEFRILADYGLGLPTGTLMLPAGTSETSDYSEVTPMASLSYQATENLNLYATYSQGLKGGGFTQNIFPPALAIPAFEPEKLKSYEVGFKFLGLNNRLRLNGAAFYGDYTDVQIVVMEGVAPTVRNAAAGEIKGFELEMEAFLTESLRIEGGIGYLDAKYTEVAGEAALIGVDVSDKFPNAPKWTTSLGVSYMIDTDYGIFTPRADWTYQSEVYNDAINSEIIKQDGYHLLNLILRYEAPDRNWSVTAGVRNLTDETYLVTGYADPTGIGIAEGVFDVGRRYFISGKFEF